MSVGAQTDGRRAPRGSVPARKLTRLTMQSPGRRGIASVRSSADSVTRWTTRRIARCIRRSLARSVRMPAPERSGTPPDQKGETRGQAIR